MDGRYFSPRNAERIAETVRKSEAGPSGERLPTRPLHDINYSRVTFRNDNAGTAPAYGVLRVTGMVASDGVNVFKVDQPSTSFQRLYLVNGPEDVATGAFGWGTWLWHAGEVLYDSGDGTPAYGESWGAKSGQWTLAKNRPGFNIMAGNSSSPDRVAAVQQTVDQLIGKADGAITTSGTVSVWMGPAGTEADSSMDVTAWVWGASISSGKKVSLAWINSAWYAGKTEC